MHEDDIRRMVQEDVWMMQVLTEAQALHLPDWLIGAGFLRNKVWDHLHGMRRSVADTHDIDLVYFDAENADEAGDVLRSKNMKGKLGLDWEIVNQAYTHVWHDRMVPYRNTSEALAEWVETATCVGVTLVDGELRIVAPHGIEDLVNLVVRPTPCHQKNLDLFHKRITSKKWLEKWPKLKVIETV